MGKKTINLNELNNILSLYDVYKNPNIAFLSFYYTFFKIPSLPR